MVPQHQHRLHHLTRSSSQDAAWNAPVRQKSYHRPQPQPVINLDRKNLHRTAPIRWSRRRKLCRLRRRRQQAKADGAVQSGEPHRLQLPRARCRPPTQLSPTPPLVPWHRRPHRPRRQAPLQLDLREARRVEPEPHPPPPAVVPPHHSPHQAAQAHPASPAPKQVKAPKAPKVPRAHKAHRRPSPIPSVAQQAPRGPLRRRRCSRHLRR